MTDSYTKNVFGTLVDGRARWCRGGGFWSVDVCLAAPDSREATTVVWGLRPDPRIVSLIVAIANRERARSRFLQAFEGVIGIWADTVTMCSLVISAIVLMFFIWVCVSGGNLEVLEAIRLRKETSGEVWLALSGVVLILFALMLRLRPILGTFDLVWLVAGCALLFGLFEIVLGREVRFMQHA